MSDQNKNMLQKKKQNTNLCFLYYILFLTAESIFFYSFFFNHLENIFYGVWLLQKLSNLIKYQIEILLLTISCNFVKYLVKFVEYK